MLTVYHGAQTAEVALSLNEVGSGAGVAHEGYGLYFSTSESLAETYRHPGTGVLLSAELSERRFFNIDDSFESLPIDIESLVSAATGSDPDKVASVLDAIVVAAPMSMSGGHLKSLIEQALLMHETDLDLDDFDLEDDIKDDFNALRVLQLSEFDTVHDLYKSLAANMAGEDDDAYSGARKASEFFDKNLGVAGFSFQDGRTQSYGEDVVNYVVFDVSVLKNIATLTPAPTRKPKP